jgi:hypothetical protein
MAPSSRNLRSKYPGPPGATDNLKQGHFQRSRQRMEIPACAGMTVLVFERCLLGLEQGNA